MKNKAMKIWESVWAPEEENSSTHPIVKKLKFIVQLFYSATQRFQKDEDLVRAASISYAIVVSFIPTLLVGLILVANFINIRDYEELAKEYVRKNGIPLDVSTYFKIIYDLLNNTAALTGIGFLFVLFSTTSVLRNLEDAMNKIWHIKQKRPFIQKVAEFIMIIIFGPLLLIVSLTTGSKILNEFSTPSLIKMISLQDKEWILGDKRLLLAKDTSGNFGYTRLMSKVDFEFQKEPVVFDPETNKILTPQELLPLQHRVQKSSLSDLRKSYLTDITSVGDDVYITSENGTLIFSHDGGNYWEVQKFQRKQLNLLVKAGFTKVYFFDKKNGVILGKSGTIIKTSNGGESWYPKFQRGIDIDFYDIKEISPGVHLAVGESMGAYITTDKGETWAPYSPIQNLEAVDRENLNSIDVKGNQIFVCGNSGIILKSFDGGLSWEKQILAYKKIDFHDILMLDKNNGLLIGDSGNIRYTNDSGDSWRLAKIDIDINLLYAYHSKSSDNIYILGENHHILVSEKPGSLENFKILQKTPFWRFILTGFASFLLPFVVLWLIFFFVYTNMPYTKVHFKPAAIGSVITSLAIVGFLIGFQIYLSYFSAGKFAVYGTLAAIPFSLLLVYVSTIIVLYGCELSFLLQHPGLITLAYHKRDFKDMEKHQIWKGIQLLHKVYLNYKEGKGESQIHKLMKACNIEADEMERIIDVYMDNGIISKTERGGILPIKSAENINLEWLTDILSPSGYDITDYDAKNILIKDVKPLFEEYSKTRKAIFGNRTLADLLHPKKGRTTV